MNIVYMGTPDFAVPALEKLIKKYNVTAVVTQPDKPKGRGKKIIFSPVKELALKNNIEVFQPEKVKDENFIKEMEKLNPDIIVVAAYGQILNEKILNLPKYGCINIHGSLLPKYRGAAPIQWSIINGEEKTGVTIMYMEKGLDTGDMILKKEIPINKEDTYGSVHDKMSLVGAEAVIEAIEMIEKGNVNAQKQDDTLSSYAVMISKDIGHIDWNKNSNEIINLIRGLNPAPIAYTFYEDEVLKIWEAEQICCELELKNGEIIDVMPKKGILVKTNDSAILIKEIQQKGGKKMSCPDYLRGHNIKKGTILK